MARYEDMLSRQVSAEWLVGLSADLRNAARRTMMSLGLAVGSMLCASYVSEGTFTVGDYVLFVSYIEQVGGVGGGSEALNWAVSLRCITWLFCAEHNRCVREVCCGAGIGV